MLGQMDLTGYPRNIHPSTDNFPNSLWDFSRLHVDLKQVLLTNIEQLKSHTVFCLTIRKKPDFNSNRNYRKYTDSWKLNSTLLYDSQVKGVIKKEKNENENTAHQNLWNAAKRTLRGKLRLQCCLEDLGKNITNKTQKQ